MTTDERDGHAATLVGTQPRIEEIVRVALTGTGVTAFPSLTVDEVLAALRKSADRSGAEEILLHYMGAADRWSVALRQVLEQFEAADAASLEPQFFTEEWWDYTLKDLDRLFREDPASGLKRWLSLYATALTTWHLDACARLSRADLPFPEDAAGLRRSCFVGAVALHMGYSSAALDMLTSLIEAADAHPPKFSPDEESRLRLLILRGRAILYGGGDSEAANQDFERAKTEFPDDGRPLAALAEYARSRGDHDGAFELNAAAINLTPNDPDGLIGNGLLFEAKALWDEADDWYERALNLTGNNDSALGPEALKTLDCLLAPISSNVFLQLARMLSRSRPEDALDVVNTGITEARVRATRLSLNHNGSFTERIGFRLKGQILETLGRDREAAEAHYEAGWRFASFDDRHVGLELLTRANMLNPDHVDTYWALSDALRIQSYVARPSPTPKEQGDEPLALNMVVDPETISRSRAVWEAGARIQLPDVDSSHAYVSRALTNEMLGHLPGQDLSQLWWGAIVFLERSIVLYSEDPYRWAYLGRIHRFLGNESTSLQATARAISINPDNPAALEERAAILANVGFFDEAFEVVERRREQEPNPWVDGVKAYLLMRTRQLDEALTLIESALSMAPFDLWLRELRADCLWDMGRTAKANEEYEQIWKQYDSSDVDNLAKFAWAAYNLGHVEQCLNILDAMRDYPGPEQFTVFVLIGLCNLHRGHIPEGELALEEAVRRAINVRQLDDLQLLLLSRLEQTPSADGIGSATQLVIDRTRDRMNTRKRELALPRSAETELLEIIGGRVDREVGVGARAGLARLHVEEKRWEEAAGEYEELLRQEGNKLSLFPEARIGAHKALAGLSSAFLDADNVDGVARAQRRLLDLELISSLDAELAIATAEAAAGRIDEARDRVERAMPALSSVVDRVRALQFLGDIFWDARHIADAHAAYERAVLEMREVTHEATERELNEPRRQHMDRFMPRLTAPLPDGWLAEESLTLTAPDGVANVIASGRPAEPNVDTKQFGDAQGELLKNSFAGFHEIDYGPVDLLGGRKGYLRHFTWTPEDREPVIQLQLYCVDDGRAYTATATSNATDVDRLQRDLRLILGGLLFERL